MKCFNCGGENVENAKFCKHCGEPLDKKRNIHQDIIKSFSKPESERDNTKIIIVALIVIALVLAGAYAYITFSNNNSHASDETQDVIPDNITNTIFNDSESETEPASAQNTQTTSLVESTQEAASPMTILSGSISTGSGLSDKTYAQLYVGSQHSGENVKVQIYYSRDGADLNNGNIVPKTVDSNGYIDIASANSFKYYPDLAKIYLYDSSGNILDSKFISLQTDSGTQNF